LLRWQFSGYYACVQYQYYGNAKTWSNPLEDRRGKYLPNENHVHRALKPRHLCFLNSPDSENLPGVTVLSVADWEARQRAAGEPHTLRYLFVAYSAEHFSHSSPEDLQALDLIAETAARQANLPAYWIASSCMRDDAELERDASHTCNPRPDYCYC
jgi:hypothetical protein